MKIYLIDKNREMIAAWNKVFENEKDIEIVYNDFFSFMYSHNVDCIVSPANAFGLMDGGYDRAITEFFGRELMSEVQNYIIKNYYGEQPIGTAFIIDIPHTTKKLIHTPTMRTPRNIKDECVIYYATRETLRVAKQNNVESILIPAFGGGTGCLDFDEIAKTMKLAYDSINNIPDKIDWDYAYSLPI